MYNPHNWVSEEIITAEKLNNIETGIQDTEKEIETKQDKLGYTPADDSKVSALQTQVTEQLAQTNDKANTELLNILYPPIPFLAAVGDGVTDDTSAIQNLLNYLRDIGGGTLFIPAGKTFIVGDLKLYSGSHIKGNALDGYLNSLIPSLKAKTGSFSVIDINNADGFTIENLIIDGNNKSSSGLNSKGEGGRIYKVKFVQCATAIGGYAGRYLGTTNIIECYFNRNGTGVTNLRDSKILDSFFYEQSDSGINLTDGSNDNVIQGNKLEWNTNNGIGSYLANHNIINANVIDRNGDAGISLISSSYTSITSNMFRRNGATTTEDNQKSHIFLQGCTEITETGNTTVIGNTQDDGSGISVPKYAQVVRNSTDVNVMGNDLKGFVTQCLLQTGNTRLLFQLNTGAPDKDTVINVVPQAQYDALTDKTGLYVIQG